MLFYTLLMMISIIVGFNTIGVHSRYCYEGQFASHDTSCSKYQVCRNSRFIERDCDFGVWNEEDNRCEFSITSCRVRTDNSWHSLKVPVCNSPRTKNYSFPHPFDCSKFFKCDKTVLVEKVCPAGLFWNQDTTSCEPDSTCEAVQPRYGANKIKHEPEFDWSSLRRRNTINRWYKVDEDDRIEKPSSRKSVDLVDDEDNDSFGV